MHVTVPDIKSNKRYLLKIVFPLVLQEDHHRLYVHNQAVLSYAKSKGFSVVDTFGMTMARYKEFLPGKCACHFHKVCYYLCTK